MIANPNRTQGFHQAKLCFRPKPIAGIVANLGAGDSSFDSNLEPEGSQPPMCFGLINEGFDPLDPNKESPWERHRVQWEGDNGDDEVNAWEMVREEDRCVEGQVCGRTGVWKEKVDRSVRPGL